MVLGCGCSRAHRLECWPRADTTAMRPCRNRQPCSDARLLLRVQSRLRQDREPPSDSIPPCPVWPSLVQHCSSNRPLDFIPHPEVREAHCAGNTNRPVQLSRSSAQGNDLGAKSLRFGACSLHQRSDGWCRPTRVLFQPHKNLDGCHRSGLDRREWMKLRGTTGRQS